MSERTIVLDLKNQGLSQVVDFNHGCYYKVKDVIKFFSEMLGNNAKLKQENEKLKLLTLGAYNIDTKYVDDPKATYRDYYNSMIDLLEPEVERINTSAGKTI